MKVDLQKVGYLALCGGLNRQTAQHFLHTMHSDCAYARPRDHMRLSMKMYQEDPDDLKKHANNPSEINNSHDPAFDVYVHLAFGWLVYCGYCKSHETQ